MRITKQDRKREYEKRLSDLKEALSLERTVVSDELLLDTVDILQAMGFDGDDVSEELNGADGYEDFVYRAERILKTNYEINIKGKR